MASKQAGWRIYKQQMGLLEHGDALWEPAPIHSYKRVKLGDVGYIRRGRFHLLFSAGRPLGSRKPGVDVPLTFEPLDVGPIIFSQPRLPGYLCTSTVKETGAGLGASVCATPFLEPGASLSFELTEKQGAALVTKYRTYREDIELESAFEEYTKRHYDSWVTFARNARHGNDIKPVLVTGVDMTRDFAMIAYSNNSTRLSSEFTTSVPLLVSASASAWGAWHTQGLVHTNCGPQLCSPPSSPDTLDLHPSDANQVDITPNEYNQCVFIRYYTVRRRALMFPKVIKAAAGPHNFDPGNNYDETLLELTVQSSTDSDTGSDNSGDSITDYSSSVTSYESELEVFHNASSEEEDAFDAIAEYVFQNSEAEAILVHHHDIAKIREGIPGTEISDILSERQPPIEVDSIGVGRLVHRCHQQLAITLPTTIDPSPVAIVRHLFSGLLPSQSSDFLIRPNEEDAWILSRGLLLLLATHSKSVETLSLNTNSLRSVLDYLTRIPISGIILVGTAGVAGMFMGQSTRTSKSLLTPLNLLPSSWQFDPTSALLQGGIPEETLLVVLAEKYLHVEPNESPSKETQGRIDILLPVKHTSKRGTMKGIQRHSLPYPAVVMGERDELVSRPKSLRFRPLQNTRDEVESTPPEGLSGGPLPFGDLNVSSPKGNGWRYSARSVASNGGGSVISLEPRSRLSHWRSSDQLSLSSNVSSSSSSAHTRFSGSTTSTLFTSPSSGTISKQSSRGSVLQREKRFSNIKMMDGIPWELDELPQPGTPRMSVNPGLGGSTSRRLKTVPQRTSSDDKSIHTTEHGVLPPPLKLHGRKYAASLTSLLRRRKSSDETRSVDAVLETNTSNFSRRARFKQFIKSIFKV